MEKIIFDLLNNINDALTYSDSNEPTPPQLQARLMAMIMIGALCNELLKEQELIITVDGEDVILNGYTMGDLLVKEKESPMHKKTILKNIKKLQDETSFEKYRKYWNCDKENLRYIIRLMIKFLGVLGEFRVQEEKS
jgi:hypothetical protein